MIVLASPNVLLRQKYNECLRDSYSVVEVANLLELTRVLRSGQPDVVFVDLVILTSKPQATLRTLSLQYPKVSFAVFGCDNDRAFYRALLTAGARGLLPLSSPPQLAPKVVETMKRGELWLSRRGLALMALFLNETQSESTDEWAGLSEREVQVGRIAAAGLSNKEIARSLDISERTVKAHISSLFLKLGIRERAELILLSHNRISDVHVKSQNIEHQIVRGANRATGRRRCAGVKT